MAMNVKTKKTTVQQSKVLYQLNDLLELLRRKNRPLVITIEQVIDNYKNSVKLAQYMELQRAKETQRHGETQKISIRSYSPDEVVGIYKPNGAIVSIQQRSDKESLEDSKKALPKKAKRDSLELMAIPTAMGVIDMKVKLSRENGSGFWIVTAIDNGVVVLSKGKETREIVSSRKGTGNNVFWVVPSEAIVKKYNRLVRKGKLC